MMLIDVEVAVAVGDAALTTEEEGIVEDADLVTEDAVIVMVEDDDFVFDGAYVACITCLLFLDSNVES